MGEKSQIAVIEIRIHNKDGWCYATSADVPELHVCGTDKRAVMSDVMPILKRLYKLNHGLDITVIPAASADLKPVKKPSLIQDHFVRLLAFAAPELQPA